MDVMTEVSKVVDFLTRYVLSKSSYQERKYCYTMKIYIAFEEQATYRRDKDNFLVQNANSPFSFPLLGVVEVLISIDTTTLELEISTMHFA